MRKLLIALIIYLLFFSPTSSYGMTLDELPITGTVKDAEAVNDYLAWFPSSVALLYRQRGGRIVMIPCERLDSIARRYGDYSECVHGLYVLRSKKIYLANTFDTPVVTAHELGHFLYEETRPSWSAADRARWTDSEDFAQHYSRRDADFRDIERCVERLLERQ